MGDVGRKREGGQSQQLPRAQPNPGKVDQGRGLQETEALPCRCLSVSGVKAEGHGMLREQGV